jgi:hypothetical protein
MSLDGSLGTRAVFGDRRPGQWRQLQAHSRFWPRDRRLGLTAGYEPAAESLQADASWLTIREHTFS